MASLNEEQTSYLNVTEQNPLNQIENALQKIEMEGFNTLKTMMQKLYAIWNEFGLKSSQAETRTNQVFNHIHSLIQDIIEEEINLCEDLKERIQNYVKKIGQLSTILSVTPIEVQGSLIKKEEKLRLELDNLTKLKNKRIKDYQDLKSEELRYIKILNLPERHLSFSTGVPTENELKEFEQHISTLKFEKEERHKKFCALKDQLVTLLETMELLPETSFEETVVFNKDIFSLSDDTFKALENAIQKFHMKQIELETQKTSMMNKLSVLWQRLKTDESTKNDFVTKHSNCKLSTIKSIEQELKRCNTIKRENLKQFIDALKVELEQLWSKCCISDSQKQSFLLYSSSEFTDEVLEAFEAEVEKWKTYYDSVKHILENIEKRQKLFDLLNIFDQKAIDPNRFKNRKGNLLKEEKERKKLQKDLPALENAILQDIDKYESEKCTLFYYSGEDFRDLVSKQWAERMNRQENVKLERQKQHLLQVQNDVVFGSPSKRPIATTPKSAPSKLLKSRFGTPMSRTPTAVGSKKMVPKTVGRAVAQLKFGTPASLTPAAIVSKKIAPNSVRRAVKAHAKCDSAQKVEKSVLREQNRLRNSETSPNGTTYSTFANELNSTKKAKCRSSVLATKKPGGTRITQSNKQRKNYKSSRKCPSTTSKTAMLTPVRGKFGLPILM